MHDDDLARETPPVVIGSIALGVAPLPFLGVYAVLFIAHGFFFPVQPPDITSSRAGEAVAGVVALALAVLLVLSIFWFLDGRRRWPFVIGQLAALGTAVDFVVDSTKGSPAVPIVVVLTSAGALVLALLAPSWAHVGRPRSRGYTGRRRTAAAPQRARSDETAREVSA